mmetsp:Transcript_7226/g.15715  ORF Transcript_7226/g.15715 Transcript_7226/m.15715 type:complete len:195 (-) Transcript_7226:1068-1652(-)
MARRRRGIGIRRALWARRALCRPVGGHGSLAEHGGCGAGRCGGDKNHDESRRDSSAASAAVVRAPREGSRRDTPRRGGRQSAPQWRGDSVGGGLPGGTTGERTHTRLVSGKKYESVDKKIQRSAARFVGGGARALGGLTPQASTAREPAERPSAARASAENSSAAWARRVWRSCRTQQGAKQIIRFEVSTKNKK